MPFHRTPAEMAADCSYAFSGCGSSTSRHMLWLTDADLAEIGPEPVKGEGPQDGKGFTRDRAWSDWWSAIGRAVGIRRNEAYADPEWAAEYNLLLRDRLAAAPLEHATAVGRHLAFDRVNTRYELTAEEQDHQTLNWDERWRHCRAYNKIKDKESPEALAALAAMKECDRINDDYCERKGKVLEPFVEPTQAQIDEAIADILAGRAK